MTIVLVAAAGTQAACRACLPRSCHQQPLSAAPGLRSITTSARKPRWVAPRARDEDEVEPVPPAMLSRLDSDEELEEEAKWVSSMVCCWLDEEWPAQELLEVHANLAAATGQAYTRVRRQQGIEEMGDLVLALASDIMTSFDFYPTFTSAFEVSNKVVELLMLRGGCDVCCTSDSDRTAITRFEAQLQAAAASQQQQQR